MTVHDFLLSTTKKFKAAGIASARLDALILLEDATGKDRSWLLAHPEHALKLPKRPKGQTFRSLEKLVGRRAEREPLAYIRGHAEFYGRRFCVRSDLTHSVVKGPTFHTLVPRPESESFIEILKSLKLLYKTPPCTIVDVGTGSGCLGITAALEMPGCEVILTDIDPGALAIARQNAQALGAKVEFLEGGLLQPFLAESPELRVRSPDVEKLSALSFESEPEGSSLRVEDSSQLSVLMANLPYVPDGLVTSQEIAYEPELALFAGPDGLDLYRRFFKQIQALPGQPRYILTESLENQHPAMAKLAQNADYKLQSTEGLVQLFASIKGLLQNKPWVRK